jgi:hypothetical protein
LREKERSSFFVEDRDGNGADCSSCGWSGLGGGFLPLFGRGEEEGESKEQQKGFLSMLSSMSEDRESKGPKASKEAKLLWERKMRWMWGRSGVRAKEEDTADCKDMESILFLLKFSSVKDTKG